MKFFRILDKPVHISILKPSIFLALFIMILNDHFLKHSELLPGVVTGKISDLAFLYFAPISAAWLFKVKKVRGLVLTLFVFATGFVFLNTSVPFSLFIEKLFFSFGFPTRLWPDATDLLALLVIPFSVKACFTNGEFNFSRRRNLAKYTLVSVSILACLYTSPGRPSTHTPVYMDWVNFRESVKIKKPQSIEVRGKIYIKDNYLFVNEPNKGIHIYDITDKENPVAVSFIELYGNVDLAVQYKTLYADSFTDLLIFDISNPEEPVFVRRINDQFEYNPVQAAPPGAVINEYDYEDASQGVIIGWEEK
ncbi:MAG: hypothetical protein ABUK01_10485 [Leptospirales bacterium]